MTTTTVTVDDVDLDVDFIFYKGEPEYCYEGEDPYVEVEAVRICDTYIDITPLLSERTISNIENQIFEGVQRDLDY